MKKQTKVLFIIYCVSLLLVPLFINSVGEYRLGDKMPPLSENYPLIMFSSLIPALIISIIISFVPHGKTTYVQRYKRNTLIISNSICLIFLMTFVAAFFVTRQEKAQHETDIISIQKPVILDH